MQRRLAVVVGVTALAMVVAAPASAGQRDGCTVRGATVVVRTDTGIVFVKRKSVDGRTVRRVYGCLFRYGRIVSLGSRRQSFTVSGVDSDGARPAIAGRYVAYGQNFGERTRTGARGVNVVDLSTGTWVAGFQYALDNAWDLSRLVVKRTGSVAWSGHEGPVGANPNRVSKIDIVHPVGPQPVSTRTVLDEDPGVVPGSLRLSADRRSIIWRKCGETSCADVSAPLA